MSMRQLAVFAFLLLCQACADADEDGATGMHPTPLGSPEATFPEDFGYVHAVRELPGGDVLVPDPLGKALYRVDMDAGVRTVVGTLGEGPGEYLQPDAAWPLPGDSTLLVDLGNGHLARLGPELGFGAAHPIAVFPDGGNVVMAIPSAVDAEGRVYVSAMGGYPPPDSAAILRVDLAEGSVETVAWRKIREYKVTESDGDIVRMSEIPLSPEDAWGAAADGSVVVARSGAYGVDWMAADGSVTHGDTIPYEPVPITNTEKAEHFQNIRRHARVGWTITRSSTGSSTVTFARGGSGGSEEPDYDNYTWPNVKPALHPVPVCVDPMGRAWVRRHVPAGAGTAYDLFDRQGRLVKALTIGGDRVVAGFGRESVYMVSFDEFDLAYLERYALPGG